MLGRISLFHFPHLNLLGVGDVHDDWLEVFYFKGVERVHILLLAHCGIDGEALLGNGHCGIAPWWKDKERNGNVRRYQGG